MAQISVIVPVYKVEKYLGRCIDSILNQTFTDFELILVDDGSPDNCGRICDEYAEKDNRVVVVHKENGGLSEARNAGIEKVIKNNGGEWISFIDSDDWVHPRYLEILYNAATKYNADVSICNYQETDGIVQQSECGQVEIIMWKPEDFFVKHRVNFIVAWGKLYKKELFREIRYPEGKLHEDEFVTYKILFELPEVAVVGIPLYYYFQNKTGIMRSELRSKSFDQLYAYIEQLEYFEAKQLQTAKMCVARSYAGFFCGKLKEADEQKQESKTRKKLLKELRNALKKYREQIPIDECRWAYAVAYPKKTKFCDIVQRIWKHIFR